MEELYKLKHLQHCGLSSDGIEVSSVSSPGASSMPPRSIFPVIVLLENGGIVAPSQSQEGSVT